MVWVNKMMYGYGCNRVCGGIVGSLITSVLIIIGKLQLEIFLSIYQSYGFYHKFNNIYSYVAFLVAYLYLINKAFASQTYFSSTICFFNGSGQKFGRRYFYVFVKQMVQSLSNKDPKLFQKINLSGPN